MGWTSRSGRGRGAPPLSKLSALQALCAAGLARDYSQLQGGVTRMAQHVRMRKVDSGCVRARKPSGFQEEGAAGFGREGDARRGSVWPLQRSHRRCSRAVAQAAHWWPCGACPPPSTRNARVQVLWEAWTSRPQLLNLKRAQPAADSGRPSELAAGAAPAPHSLPLLDLRALCGGHEASQHVLNLGACLCLRRGGSSGVQQQRAASAGVRARWPIPAYGRSAAHACSYRSQPQQRRPVLLCL